MHTVSIDHRRHFFLLWLNHVETDLMPPRRTSSLKVVKTCSGVLAHQRLKEGLDRGGASNPEPGAVPEIRIRRAEEDGATKRDALGFWAIALAGSSPRR